MNKYAIYLFSSIACVVCTIKNKITTTTTTTKDHNVQFKKKSNTHLIRYLPSKQTSKL